MKINVHPIKHIGFIGHVSIGLLLIALAGCSASSRITNIEPISVGGGYQAEYRSKISKRHYQTIGYSNQIDRGKCISQEAPAEYNLGLRDEERLSPGDLVDVAIGTDETLSGKYEVAIDGMLKIRGLPAVRAYRRKVDEVNADITTALVQSKYYTHAPPVSVRLADYGTVHASVSGAVFEAGSVTLGGSNTGAAIDITREQALGSVAEGRTLSHALQNAGGVRPDADLSRVILQRGTETKQIDLRAAIKGEQFSNDLILEGDRIIVPSRGCFQPELVTPSIISPVGVKVFMSNLTEPAQHNSASVIQKETREMRYGTRFIQTVVSMNCVGGSKMTNASRSAVLYSRNPITGKSVVIERNIEDLLRNGDRDEYDPYILPEDAIACYDSNQTDVIKVAQGFGIVASSILLGRGL